MPEKVIGRVHELAMLKSADVYNGHDDILDYDDESERLVDPNEAQFIEDEYNCDETMDQNSGVLFLDPRIQ